MVNVISGMGGGADVGLVTELKLNGNSLYSNIPIERGAEGFGLGVGLDIGVNIWRFGSGAGRGAD
jgi:hypothetical protein